MDIIKKFFKDESGAPATEYGLLVALIALAIVAGAIVLGSNLNTMFSNIGTYVGQFPNSVGS